MQSDTWKWQPYCEVNKPSLWATINVRQFHGTDGHWAPPFDDKRGGRLMTLLTEEEWGFGEIYEQVLKRRWERRGDLGYPWTQEDLDHQIRRDWQSGYFPIKRWDPGKPGAVIYGGAINNIIHPYLPRRLTHREVARAMGFPDSWKIEPLEADRGLRDYWGKGITAQCGQWLGNYLRYAVENDARGLPEGQLVGERERLYEIKPGRKKS
jgi:site-specific DNA-cytosine methylase